MSRIVSDYFLQVLKRKGKHNPFFGLQLFSPLLFLLLMESQKGEKSFHQERNAFCISVIFRRESTKHGGRNLKPVLPGLGTVENII